MAKEKQFRVRALQGLSTVYSDDVDSFQEAVDCFNWACKIYDRAEVTVWDREMRATVKMRRAGKKEAEL